MSPKRANDTLSKRTIRISISCLRVLYGQAIRHGLVSINPATGLGEFYRQAPMAEVVEPLNQEEVVLLLKAAIGSEPEDYPLLLCALHSGLRCGELSGLWWEDIDWAGKFIKVRRQIVRGTITSVKTKHGNRKVDCSDELLEVLSSLRKDRLEESMKKGNPSCS